MGFSVVVVDAEVEVGVELVVDAGVEVVVELVVNCVVLGVVGVSVVDSIVVVELGVEVFFSTK